MLTTKIKIIHIPYLIIEPIPGVFLRVVLLDGDVLDVRWGT